MAIRAVSFDLDYTLLDHSGASARAFTHMLSEMDEIRGTQERPDHLSAVWRRVSNDTIQLYIDGLLSFTEQQEERIRRFASEILGYALSSLRARELFAIFLAEYQSSWSPFDDVMPCIETLQLSGVRVAVVTNGDFAQQRAKSRKLGLGEERIPLIISEEVSSSKPNRRIFEHAAEKVGCELHMMAHVGDSVSSDVVGASNAGMTAIWLDRSQHGSGPSPSVEHRRISSLVELPELLGAL